MQNPAMKIHHCMYLPAPAFCSTTGYPHTRVRIQETVLEPTPASRLRFAVSSHPREDAGGSRQETRTESTPVSPSHSVSSSHPCEDTGERRQETRTESTPVSCLLTRTEQIDLPSTHLPSTHLLSQKKAPHVAGPCNNREKENYFASAILIVFVNVKPDSTPVIVIVAT